MRTTIYAGLIAVSLFAMGQVHAEATPPPALDQSTVQAGQRYAAATPGNTERVTLDDLRKDFPWTQGKSDVEIVLALSQKSGHSPAVIADQLGLNPQDYARYNNPAMAGGESSNQQHEKENLAISLAGDSKIGAGIVVLIAVGLGGGIGYLLRKLIAPKNSPTSPNDMARTWLGWVVVPVSAVQLSRSFLYLEPAYFVVWLIGVVMLGGGAYALGLLYGKFKYGQVVSTSTGNAHPAAQTPADSPVTHGRQPGDKFDAGNANELGLGNTVDVPPDAGEEDLYALAMSEIESGTVRPGVWAKAFADSMGDENKAKALYLKNRVTQERAALG